MNDWKTLAADWQRAPSPAVPSSAQLQQWAARAAREAWLWRWKWRLVQACVWATCAFALFAQFQQRTVGFKLFIGLLAVLSVGAWWAARSTMNRLTADAHSVLDHLRAQRARAASIPWFVAIDAAVYLLCAIALAALSLGIGLAPALSPSSNLLPLWLLLAAGGAYDLIRWQRSQVQLRQLDRLLASLGAQDR